MKKPKVGIILTGGTLDSVGHDRLDLAWYIEAGQRLPPGGFVSRIPELGGLAEVTEITFPRMASHALRDTDWLALLQTAHEALAGDALDGLVIGHGTNTLEETALFLHLTLKTDKPVVLVGAMRPSSALSCDGDLNLLEAVRVAGNPASRGRGCLVVMSDRIFSARDVTKNSTYRVDAFQSRDVGPLGFADADGRVVFYHGPARPHTTATEFDVAPLQALPRTDVVVSYVGADGVAIEALANA